MYLHLVFDLYLFALLNTHSQIELRCYLQGDLLFSHMQVLLL